MGIFSNFRTPKPAVIEFAPLFEGLDEYCAPQPAIKFFPDWYKQMSLRVGGAHQSDIPVHDRHLPEGKTIKSCPAISDLFKVGYVLPLWTDFSIEVQEGGGFDWHSGNPRHEIQFHGPQQLAVESTRPNELNYVVKFVSPWRFRAPKDHLILLKGLFYHTDAPFRVCEGILDGSVTSTMNVNTFWSAKPAKHLLKRNSALAVMIPFPKHAYEALIHSDPAIARRWDERNKTMLFDTFDNNYRQLTDRRLNKLFGWRKAHPGRRDS
ncbi:hypothetical protein EON80_23160 [bacterium]|nr:MAG: hypothetical protein EON80_23160 [bacterium]